MYPKLALESYVNERSKGRPKKKWLNGI